MEEGQERRIQLNSGRAQLDEYFIGNEAPKCLLPEGRAGLAGVF